jgi:hypothetical protein
MASYLKKFDKFQPKTTQTINQEGIFAGNESGYKVNERIKITTELISEKYKSK